ncbi:MAG TPA: PAS domain-containing protein [bacterium]|nr:PAS domain-containing protein [bacterium]
MRLTMAEASKPLFGKPKSAGDNLLFLRLRWFLGLWIGVTLGLFYGGRGWLDYSSLGLVALFLGSQLVLWKLPPTWFRGLQLHTAVFLLDLFFSIATLLLTDLASPALLATLFLSIFICALVKRLSLGALVGVVATGVYLAFKTQGPDGFTVHDPRQLLDVPFIFLSSLHTAIIVSEATFRQDVSEALDADNQTLSKKLGNTASELKNRIRFINSAFDAVPAPALVVDGDGLLRSFNTRAEDLFNAKRMSVLDKPLKDISFLEPLRQILRSAGGDGSASGWLFTAKGVRFYASLRSGAARDPDGHLMNLAVFVQPTLPPAEPEPASAASPAQDAPDAEAAAPRQRPAFIQSIAATVQNDHPDQRGL